MEKKDVEPVVDLSPSCPRPPPPNFFLDVYFIQFYALMYKAFRLSTRAYVVTITRFVVPPLIVFIFWLCLFTAPSGEVQHPETRPPIGPIPLCVDANGGHDCVSFLYSPDTADVQKIVSLLLSRNDVDGFSSSIMATNMTQSEIAQYVLDHQNTTQIATFFNTQDDGKLQQPNVQYYLFFNATSVFNYATSSEVYPSTFLFQAQHAIDQAIAAFLTQEKTSAPELKINTKDFPQPPNNNIYTVLSYLLIVFLFIAVSLPFFFLLYSVIHERSSGLRGFMTMMGLRDAVWWCASMVEHGFFYVVPFFLIECVGYAVPLAFFRSATFGVHLIPFAAYAFAMLAWVMILATFIHSTKGAVVVGFGIFFGGLICATISTALGPLIFDLWEESVVERYGHWGVVLSLFPPFSFCACLLLIQLTTTGGYYTNYQSANFGYSQIYTSPAILQTFVDSAPTMNYFLLFLFIEGLVLFIVAIYMDNVMHDEYRVGQPFYYPFSPYYWGLSTKPVSLDHEAETSTEADALLGGSMDRILFEDVHKEKSTVLNSAPSEALLIANLQKTYGGLFASCRGKSVHALDGLWLKAERGSLLCILGQNGAGKTTTIKILTGMVKATSGQATIFGRDVASEMNEIRAMIGCCPQFDLLWPRLTAFETLRVLSCIKEGRIPDSEVINKMLDDVRLFGVANRCAGTFSGGMKRRLSVAISAIGDPMVIFMDEPTTGMDPGNRRYIWDLILRMKEKRLVIITTHSMEEADVLGEKIAIMRHGKLRAVGSSLHLKAKFGSGYRLSVVCDEEKVNEVIGHVSTNLPSAQLQSTNAGSVVFSLDASQLASVERIFEWMNKETYTNEFGVSRPVVLDWGLSNTTLEDVFMKIGVDEVADKTMDEHTGATAN